MQHRETIIANYSAGVTGRTLKQVGREMQEDPIPAVIYVCGYSKRKNPVLSGQRVRAVQG